MHPSKASVVVERECYREDVEVHPAKRPTESVIESIGRHRLVVVLSELHVHRDVGGEHYKSVIRRQKHWLNQRGCRSIQLHKRCTQATWGRLSWLRE